ncbi:hypothetical protein AB5J62_10880 [Amycolatopsis sp. cg5]|uniref:hypothetical protein n=1 Tax=Amycolatopsis sp. cg5 TaxID=3238802 RepID=UPI003525A71D
MSRRTAAVGRGLVAGQVQGGQFVLDRRAAATLDAFAAALGAAALLATAAVVGAHGAEDAVPHVAFGVAGGRVHRRVGEGHHRHLATRVTTVPDRAQVAGDLLAAAFRRESLAETLAGAAENAEAGAADRAADRGVADRFPVDLVAAARRFLTSLDAEVEADHETGAARGVLADGEGELAERHRGLLEGDLGDFRQQFLQDRGQADACGREHARHEDGAEQGRQQ